MANEEHLAILKQGVEAWNKWREDNPDVIPDLSGANLIEADLRDFNISNCDLSSIILTGANLIDCNLHHVTAIGANLIHADFHSANLSEANLSGAELSNADLTWANLAGANLCSADLSGAKLIYTDLSRADLSNARSLNTVFANIDLNVLIGLDTIKNDGPSTIGIDTIYQSGGNIPEVFLQGCGVPENFISYMKSLTISAIEFYSAFISYSSKDDEFAKRLHSKMRDEQIRVWFAPEEMKAGRKIHEQIDEAIRFHDKLVLILSEESMKSEWVITEIRKARKAEKRESRQKLFPIGLSKFEKIQEWECFDSDTGKDLAIEIREYFIPDFSNWKDHNSFEKAFARLLKDLQAEKPIES